MIKWNIDESNREHVVNVGMIFLELRADNPSIYSF